MSIRLNMMLEKNWTNYILDADIKSFCDTENVCVPILEKDSGLKCGVDFKIGYSPERINPGDNVFYDIVIEAGTYSVSSIKTAEAIKAVEISQRDINIAFMNELAMVFD